MVSSVKFSSSMSHTVNSLYVVYIPHKFVCRLLRTATRKEQSLRSSKPFPTFSCYPWEKILQSCQIFCFNFPWVHPPKKYCLEHVSLKTLAKKWKKISSELIFHSNFPYGGAWLKFSKENHSAGKTTFHILSIFVIFFFSNTTSIKHSTTVDLHLLFRKFSSKILLLHLREERWLDFLY